MDQTTVEVLDVVDTTTVVISTSPDEVTVEVSDQAPIEIVLDGVVGPAGPSGAGVTVYPFVSPAATWTISHGLGRLPLVQLVDDTGAQFDADLEFPDLNTAVATHSSARAGSAVVS